MLDFLCRVIPASNGVRAFKTLGGVFLAWTLAFSIVASLPFGAFAEENENTASEELLMDPSEGGVSPQDEATKPNEPVASNEPAVSSSFDVSYRAYQSGAGWTALSENAGIAGVQKNGSIEAIELMLGGTASSYSLSGTYLVCGEDSFRNFSASDKCQIGVAETGQCLNAFSINAPVSSDKSQVFDIYYRVYLEHYGWLGWASNGQVVGSNDETLKILAVQIELVNKGNTPSAGDISSGKEAYVEISNLITYSAHVQDEGWMPSVREGSVAGTTGRGLRMEALRVQLGSQAAQGSVEARGHVSDLGWQGWSEGGCGTEGRGLALEAVCLRLTGQAAETYDVWYRVHSADFGWMGWAKNGEEAGSQGFGRAVQAVEVRLLPKGSAAPGDTSGAFVNKSGQDLKFKVTYRSSEISPSSTSNGSYRYVLPSAVSADQVSIAYVSGAYEALQLGSTGLTIARDGEVLASDAGATLKYASGDTISVRLGSVEVASLTLCRSSDIAALYITSDDPENYGRSYIEGSPDHSLSATGGMTMLDSEGAVVYEGGLTQIKGRGNTTWSCTKKPYQIKLAKKTDLLQSGSKENKNKTWVLLANAFDATGLRNLTAYNIASAIGVKSAIESRPVDLFYDGEYRGTYQLCEKVQINTGRVDIYNLEDEIDELNEDVSSLPRARAQNKYGNTFQYTKGVVNPSDITGGYLVEYDPGRYASEASWFTVDMGGKRAVFVCKSPEYWSYEQAIYLSEYFQEAFNAVSSGGINADTGRNTTDYFDPDSVAALYWINELTCNRDGLEYSSTFMYKDRDNQGISKIIMGPGWDFDLSLGSAAITDDERFHSPDWWYTRKVAGLGSFLYGDYHLKQVIDSYRGTAVNTAREYLTEGAYDKLAEELSASRALNSWLWGSSSENASTLKYWFLQRLDWIRSQL